LNDFFESKGPINFSGYAAIIPTNGLPSEYDDGENIGILMRMKQKVIQKYKGSYRIEGRI